MSVRIVSVDLSEYKYILIEISTYCQKGMLHQLSNFILFNPYLLLQFMPPSYILFPLQIREEYHRVRRHGRVCRRNRWTREERSESVGEREECTERVGEREECRERVGERERSSDWARHNRTISLQARHCMLTFRQTVLQYNLPILSIPISSHTSQHHVISYNYPYPQITKSMTSIPTISLITVTFISVHWPLFYRIWPYFQETCRPYGMPVRLWRFWT